MNELRELSRGDRGEQLLKALAAVQDEIADLRVDLNFSVETRKAVIEALDQLLISRIRRFRGDSSRPDPNEHE
jgi:hypothetical protein